jgi:uncharacterized protein YndB with AHSA1/START domain
MKPPQARVPGSHIPDVYVRHAMPASAERVFDLMTRADQLALWLCDEAASDVVVNGKLSATWRDPTQQDRDVTRRGTWVEVERPSLAYLRWEDPSPGADPEHPEMLRVAIADAEDGDVWLTVASPCPQQFEMTNAATVQDATRQSWEQLLGELAALLRAETDANFAPGLAGDADGS